MTTANHSEKGLSPPASMQSILSNEFCGPEYNSTIVFNNDNNSNDRGSSTKRRFFDISLIVKLRTLSLLTFASALFALFLSVVAMVTNSLVRLSNKTNIYYSNESDEANTISRHLLIPEIDMIIGITRACVGAHCFARESMHGVIGLIPDESKVFSFVTSETQRSGFHHAREQFKLGFDMGVECGTSWFHVQRLTNFLLASLIITIVILAGCVAVTITLFGILTRVNALRGLVYHDPLSRLTIVGIKRDDALYFLQKIKTYLWYERKLIIASAVVALWATMWGLITMVVTIMLVNRKMKCGSSVCTSYTRSMRNLITVVVPATSTEFEQNMHGVQCKHGPTFVIVIVVFIVTCLLLLFACLILFMYTLSHRRERLRHRQIVLEEFVHNQERIIATSPAGITHSIHTPEQMCADKLVPLLDSSTPQLTTTDSNSVNINTTSTTANTFTENIVERSSPVPTYTCAQNIMRPHERVTSSSSSCSSNSSYSSSFRSVQASRTEVENTQIIPFSDTMEVTVPATVVMRGVNPNHQGKERINEQEPSALHVEHESNYKHASTPSPKHQQHQLESVNSTSIHKADKAKESWDNSENDCEWSSRERTFVLCNGTPNAMSILINEHFLMPSESAELQHNKKDNDIISKQKHSSRSTMQSAWSYGQRSDHYSSRYNVELDACGYSEGAIQEEPEEMRSSKVIVKRKHKLSHKGKEEAQLENTKGGAKKMEKSSVMCSATKQNYIAESENGESNTVNTNVPTTNCNSQKEKFCKEQSRKTEQPSMKIYQSENSTRTSGHAVGAKSCCTTPLQESCNKEHEDDVETMYLFATESVPDNPLIYKKELAILQEQRQEK